MNKDLEARFDDPENRLIRALLSLLAANAADGVWNLISDPL